MLPAKTVVVMVVEMVEVVVVVVVDRVTHIPAALDHHHRRGQILICRLIPISGLKGSGTTTS